MSLKRKKPVDEDSEEYDEVDMLETSENEEDFSEDKVLRSLHLPQKHHHTEAVGQLLVQAAVVDSNQRVVFSGHIHHDCATVEEPWQLATDVNRGRLTAESLVRQAYQDVNAASNGVHFWHQYRTHAHYLARYGTYDGNAKEINMALLGLYKTTSLKHYNTYGARCIKAGNCRKCNPIKCVSCGDNTPSWLKECSRCNDKTKRLRGRTSRDADQNRCTIDCGVAQNGKQRRCPTCLLAMERRMEQEDSSNADEEGRPRRSRRPDSSRMPSSVLIVENSCQLRAANG